MKNNFWFWLVIVCGLVLALALPEAGMAQDEEQRLSLRLSRDFGYSSGSGAIQGTFSMRASGPDNLSRVVFYIDDEAIGEATAQPFRLQFTTDVYPLGVHNLYAVGYTSDGSELRSNIITANFVSAEEGWQAAGKIVIPILVLVVVAMVASFGFTMISGRKTKNLPLGAPRSYAPLGGTICPKCGRPFAVHIFGVNLVVGKLDRCPYCRKWSLVRRYPMNALKAAEQAELELIEEESPAPALSAEERLRKDLEDSRYRDV